MNREVYIRKSYLIRILLLTLVSFNKKLLHNIKNFKKFLILLFYIIN